MHAVTRSRACLLAMPVFLIWGWGCRPAAEPPAPAETPTVAVEAEDDSTPFFGPREIVVLEELAPLMTNIFGRKSLSLNGNWSYIVDQLRIGDASPLLRGGVGEDEVG